MQVDWYGQATFRLADGDKTVVIDPFGDISGLTARGLRFDYPPIEGLEADLLLVTHEHRDHNGVETIGGDPVLLRSTAGTHESPIGEIVGVASEHDDVAGTERGPNTIFAFTFDGVRVAHFGDFGQAGLRDEQAAALGLVELLFVPVGGGPTIGAAQALAVAERLQPRWVVPMHYRSKRIAGFLEPLDATLDLFGAVHTLDTPGFALEDLPEADGPLLVVPAAP